MRRPLYTVVAVSAVAAFATSSLPAAPALAQERAAEVFAKQEALFKNRNVVSVVLPKSGSLFLDTIRTAAATRDAEWRRGEIQLATQGGTLLIWQTVPSWFHPKEEPPLQSYQAVLGEFLSKDVELAGDLATLTGDYSHEAVLAGYMGPFREAPDTIRDRRKAMATALLAEKDTKVQLGVSTSLTFYNEAGNYLGSTTYFDGKPTFKAERIDPKDIATINWYKAPKRIDPLVELTAADAARTITLNPREGARTIAALSRELSAQGLKIAPADEELATVSLYLVQRKDWTAGELLKSVASVGGFEIHPTPNGYDLSRSPAHADVGDQMYSLALSRHDRAQTLQTVLEIFVRNGNKLELPFDQKLFRTQAPIAVDNLSAQVRAKALASLDEATRREVRQVWFVLNVGLGVRGKTNGSTNGFPLTPFPAEYDLNPPAHWKGFDEAEFSELHGAKMIP